MKPIRIPAALSLLTTVALGACGEHHFEPPDREAQVAQADARFSMALFDSVTWEDPVQRGIDGNVVYATQCRNCHGQLGAGGTEYARSRELEVPSIVEPDWEFAESPDSVLHRIFVGHTAGMPTLGIAGLSAREMVAVTYYLLDVLRPEVLGGG